LENNFHFILSMTDRHATAIQLIAFVAFIAVTIFIVLGFLIFVSTQCTQGTPFLPSFFPCFPGG